MRFYGREEEIRLLRKELDLAMRNKAGRLAVVCGRRRIGKTSLIMKAFESVECPVIYLCCRKTHSGIRTHCLMDGSARGSAVAPL